jgi:hypothetical protein
MIPRMTRETRSDRLIPYLLAPLIGAVFRQGGLRRFPFFQALRLPALHRPIVRMRLFVVFRARATEKEQNFLRVPATHTVSLRPWRVAVKRTTMPHRDQGF